jgi:hypothetical protein
MAKPKQKREFVQGCPDCEEGTPNIWLMNEYVCGCQIVRDAAGGHFIVWCADHKEVDSLKEENKRLQVALRELIQEFAWRMEDKEITTEFDLTLGEIAVIERAREALGAERSD